MPTAHYRLAHHLLTRINGSAQEFDGACILGRFLKNDRFCFCDRHALCFEQQNLGLSPELALRDMARRTGLLEIKIFVLAILVQQQTGGNLAELLDRLAALIRDRFRIRGKIKTLTAEGRMQAAVLLGLPPALFLVVLFLNRGYAQILLDHPSLLVGMFISELIGWLWIRRIIHFDF